MLKSTCRVSTLRALLVSVLSKVSVNDLEDDVACEITLTDLKGDLTDAFEWWTGIG